MEISIPVRSITNREDGSHDQEVDSPVKQENVVKDTEAETARPQFLFIGETGKSRPTAAARKLVRSQARRNVTGGKEHNRQQTSHSKHLSRQLRPRGKTDKKEPSTSAVSKHQPPQRDTNTNPCSTLVTNKFDAFDALPVDEQGNSYYLLRNFHVIFHGPAERPYSPVRPTFEKGESLRLVIFDPALLHISLAHVSMSLGSLARTETGPTTLYHVGKAITMVNQRLANFTYETVTDDTICAVTVLAHLELRTATRNTVANVKIHLDGLEALVKAKGGMNQLMIRDPLTMRYTYWVDIIGAAILGLEPRFEHDNPPPHYDLEDFETGNWIGARYQSKMLNLTGLQELSQETIRVYRDLRRLVVDKERVAGKLGMGITDADFLSLQIYCFQLLYRLIALVRYPVPIANPNAMIYGLFGNAGLLHILLLTCNAPLPIRGRILLSTRIQASLKVINLPAFQIAYPEMMLWIIMIGGMASIGSEDYIWFVNLLAESCRVAGIAGTAELERFMTEFLWSQYYLGPIFDDFWADVIKEIREGIYEVEL